MNQTQLVTEVILNHNSAVITKGDDIEFSAFDWILSDTIPSEDNPAITLCDQTWVGRPKTLVELCATQKQPDESVVLRSKLLNIDDINLKEHAWESLPTEEALELHVGLKVTYGRHSMLAADSFLDQVI